MRIDEDDGLEELLLVNEHYVFLHNIKVWLAPK
jgi:hypothetical protein